MATSARIQSLLEQRKTYRGISPDRRRVLAPNRSAGVSSIARQNTKAELEAMIDRYNNGAVGNEEMRAFLQSKATDKYLNPTEKVDIQDQIADFDSRVEKDRLEATFKKAAPNSMEQVQAAKALQTYYSNRAATMAEGTPAQSQNLENAAGWEQKAIGIEDNMQKTARKNFRYTKEAEINQLPNNSSERMFEKAQLYNDLANQANADGDAVEAQRLFAQAQQYQTTANETQNREQETLQKQGESDAKNQVYDALNQLQTQYISGQIDANTYHNELLQAAPEIEKYGDSSLTLKVYKMIDTAEKKATSESSAQAGQAWDASDKEYKNVVAALNKQLGSGKLDMMAYAKKMGKVLSARYDEVGQRIEALTGRSDSDRVYYGGKSVTVAKARELLGLEYDSSSGAGYGDKTEDGGLQQKIQDFASGKVVAVIKGPDEFTTSGGVKKTGSAVAKVDFVNKDNLPDDEYAADDQGIYHRISREKNKPTQEQLQEAQLAGGFFMDENGIQRKVQFDAQSGTPYYYGDNQFVEAYKPGSSEKTVAQPYTPGAKIQSFYSYKPAQEVSAKTPDQENISTPTRLPQINSLPGIQNVAESAASALPVVGPVLQTGRAIQSVSQNLPKIQAPSFQLPKIQSQPVKNLATNVLPSVAKSLPVIGPVAQVAGLANSAVKLAPQITSQVPKAVTSTANNIGNTLGGVGNTINQGVDWLKKNIKLPKLF